MEGLIVIALDERLVGHALRGDRPAVFREFSEIEGQLIQRTVQEETEIIQIVRQFRDGLPRRLRIVHHRDRIITGVIMIEAEKRAVLRGSPVIQRRIIGTGIQFSDRPQGVQNFLNGRKRSDFFGHTEGSLLRKHGLPDFDSADHAVFDGQRRGSGIDDVDRNDHTILYHLNDLVCTRLKLRFTGSS